MIYRGPVPRKGEDQLFLTRSENSLILEQRKIVRRLNFFSPYVRWADILSLAFLIVMPMLGASEITLWVR